MSSHISVQGEQSTSTEVTTLANLAALGISAVGEFVRKTGTTTFENATLSEIISLDGLSNVTILNPTNGQVLAYDGSVWINSSSGSGTVTSVSVVTANGVSGSVVTVTTTPAITLTLGAITPSSVTVSGLTASELVATDGSKILQSLAVGTYPSLAELIHLKGVSSAIQTQLDGKSPTAGNASLITVGTVTTGVWNATDVPVSAGGTGLSTISALSIWVANALNTVTEVTPGAGNSIRINAGGTAWEAFTPGAAEANTALSNLASVAINLSLTSDTDITDDLGTGDIRWKDIHAATLNAGLTATDTLKLRGRDVDGAVYVDILTITSANTVTADLHSSVTQNGTAILLSGGALGTPSSGVGTNITGIPAASILAGSFGVGAYVISTSLQAATIELGHATDTTIARVSAGVVSVEGAEVTTLGNTTTGTGSIVRAISPAFTTPSLGVATATSYDGVLAANLVDLSATETISGEWTFNEVLSINQTSDNLTLKTTTSGSVLVNPASHNLIIGEATTGFSTIASTRAALTIAGTTSAGVLEFGLKTATNGEAILRETGYNGTTAVYSLQIDSNAGTNNTGSAIFYVNNGGGLISGIKIESDGGIFMGNLLAAAASTDVNINASKELHSVTSSKRFKTNIIDVKQDTSKIYDLEVKEYDFKKEFGGQHEVGIIAEEAEKILPQLVVKDTDGVPYSFQYSRLSVFLLAEIQKLNERIKQLEK